MRRFLVSLLLTTSVYFGFCQDIEQSFYDDLALHWAPIHYQSIRKTDGIFNRNSLGGKSDSLSQIDFDGDWIATNNWKNLASYSIIPSVYYYVAATPTHYYITYGYFHARDWTRLNFFHLAQHENDLEGIMLVIEKNDSEFGKLILGYSIFHLSIQRFFYDNNLNNIRRFQPGRVESNNHPTSYQQPRGHGVKLDDSFFKTNRPYCRYIPESVDVTTDYDKTYYLVNFLSPQGYINRRGNEEFFNEDESIKGSHGEGAKSPWLWRDHKDIKTHPDIQLFVDPANYVLIDCNFDKPFSTEYVHHPFLESQIQE